MNFLLVSAVTIIDCLLDIFSFDVLWSSFMLSCSVFWYEKRAITFHDLEFGYVVYVEQWQVKLVCVELGPCS